MIHDDWTADRADSSSAHTLACLLPACCLRQTFRIRAVQELARAAANALAPHPATLSAGLRPANAASALPLPRSSPLQPHSRPWQPRSPRRSAACVGRRGLPQTNADPDNDSDSEAALAEPDAARTSNKRTRSDASNGDAAAAATEQLHFTTVWQLNFEERLCELQAPAFCCGMCRACFDVGSMVQLAATRAGGSGGEDACASQTLIHRRSFGRCVCAFGIPARCAGGLRSSMQVQGQAWEHFYCPTLPLQFTSM